MRGAVRNKERWIGRRTPTQDPSTKYAPACVDAVDENGCSSFFMACVHGRLDVASMLVEHGVDTERANKDGITPLHIGERHTQHAPHSSTANGCSNVFRPIQLLENVFENVFKCV